MIYKRDLPKFHKFYAYICINHLDCKRCNNAYFPFFYPKIQVLLPCFYFKKSYVSSNDFRWFDEKVSSLELSAPLTILPELSVEQALSIMNNEGFDQLPVIESSGYATI